MHTDLVRARSLPPPADRQKVSTVLISVFDKTGIVDFAAALHKQGVQLLSTGGTARVLRSADLPVRDVSDVTGFPELLDGRVKSLHPAIHAGLLARRNDPDDLKSLADMHIGVIDLVVANLYPFSDAVAGGQDQSTIIENIDIGGPTLIRAAAKNFAFVGVVTDPADYDRVTNEIESNGGTLGQSTRRRLAGKAFDLTSSYDTNISDYFAQSSADDRPRLQIDVPRALELRYGENPHQGAALYGDTDAAFTKLHGKDLSFNNLLDLSAAIRLIEEFDTELPTIAILKHTNPCGVARAGTLLEAYNNAFATDRQSPFGGIVIANVPLDIETAEAIDAVFTEIIIAPDYDAAVLDFLQQKRNRRVIKTSNRPSDSVDVRSVVGGYLAQTPDPRLGWPALLRQSMQVVTERRPDEREWADLDFAWRVAKHVKSNAIVFARDQATLGIGAGQMSRIDSTEIAVAKATKSRLSLDGCVVASDAFFPFADGLLAAVTAGAVAAVQPGGSVRDDEVIEAANAEGVTMVFTGKRHFRH